MLESRLRALVRASKRGPMYSSEALENGVKVFFGDMEHFFDMEVLEDMSDTSLTSCYLIWEMVAVRSKDADERLKRIKKGIRITILPMIDQPFEEAASTNIVSLFGSPTN